MDMPNCANCGSGVDAGMEFYVPREEPGRQRTALTIACPDCAPRMPGSFRPPRGPGGP